MDSETTPQPAIASSAGLSHVIVLGNEKGGTGKSTTAMHLAVHLLRQGYRVGCLDLDARQGTLRRYIKNRLDYTKARGLQLKIPTYAVVESVELDKRSESEAREIAMLDAFISEFRSSADYLIIDTPGNNSSLSRRALTHADTLLTPMNDSFVDLDILGQVDPESYKVLRLSHYAETVFEQRKRRAVLGRSPIDWVVMRNRLRMLDSCKYQTVERALKELSQRLAFRVVSGLTERNIYRELFPKGLTLLDARDVSYDVKLSMSLIAARQEIAQLAVQLAIGAVSNLLETTGRNLAPYPYKG